MTTLADAPRVAGVPLFRADRPMLGLTWWAEVSELGTLYRAVGPVYDELAALAEEIDMTRKKAATTTLPRATEADVMAQVEDAFRVLGLTDIRRNNVGGSYHINADGSTRYVAFGEAGDADWAGVLPDGRHLDLEVKRPGERPRPEQIARLVRTNTNGGVGFWVDRGDEALRVLRRVLDGWTVVVDEDGGQWLDDGKGD